MNFCKHGLKILAALIVFQCAAYAVPAGAPQEINYQGYYRENGRPVTGNRTMKFRVTNIDGQTEYWPGADMTVAVSTGLFNVTITPTGVDWGTVTPYIEVTVAGDLLGREKIATSIYALHASTAAYAENISGINSAKLVQLDGNGYLPALNGSNLTGLSSGDAYLAANQTFTGFNTFSKAVNTGAAYQINGSTVVAVLPGNSLGVGVGAGRVNTGSNNSFLGYQAGYTNTTGGNNSFLGYQAGYSNITGGNNSFLGYQAGYNNITGGNNSFLGYAAGISNTTGADNSFLGDYAGYLNTTGGQNSFLGYQAGYNNQTGSGDTVLGYMAGLGTPGGNSFSSSTIVGYHAGYYLTTGSNNTLLGWQAGDSLTMGHDNIIIGYNVDAPANNSANRLNIGNAIYGDLSTGNIGIGTTAPTSTFTVVGTFKLVDGTQSNGYVLTSNAAGLASWATPAAGGDVYLASTQTFTGQNTFTGTIFIGSAIQSTPSGGNPRGDQAVDLQTSRGSDTQVASGYHSVIGGGGANTASGWHATVSGGVMNAAGGSFANVAGGNGNTASGLYSGVAGGTLNTASASMATVAGGWGNAAGGMYSTIAGGRDNTTKGDYSFAAGYQSSSTANGSFTWADSAGVIVENNVTDRTWFKNSGGFLVTGSTQPISDGGFFVSGAGNVGIGTTSPGVALEVAGQVKITGGSPAAGYVLTSDADGLASWEAGGGGLAVILSGDGSLGVGVDVGIFSTGDSDTFVGYQAGSANTDGWGNSFFGRYTGLANTTGNYNSFLGSQAGQSNETGGNNVFVGASAGVYNTAGNDNSFVGFNAGFSNITGNDNSFLGYQAGYNTTANNNSFVGSQAGQSNTTGGENTFMGATAGYRNTTGGQNVFVGVAAGQFNDTGGNNSFLGDGTGLYNTTGSNNTLLGYSAGQTLETGDENILIGSGVDVPASDSSYLLNIGNVIYGDLSNQYIGINTDAPDATLHINGTFKLVDSTQQDGYVLTSDADGLASWKAGGGGLAVILGGTGSLGVGTDAGTGNTGDRNVFVGQSAGYSNTTKGGNSFVGYQAGYSNITGEGNSFVGSNAGYTNTVGSYNAFVGNSAGYYNTAGGNSFFGAESGQENTVGDENSFVGYQAGMNNTTGVQNSFVGAYAGRLNVTGSANAIFGTRAGGYYSGGSFSNSTIMGYQAGSALTTGSNNILIGWQAGDSLTTGTDNIIIGYDADVPAVPGGATYKFLNIGNVIYGDLFNGQIGIGTTNPGAALEVAGQVKITGGTPGDGKVLTSNADGLASWKAGGGGDVVKAATQTFTGENTFTKGIFFDSIIQSTGGATAGNSRGANAVDLQTIRAAATQVASGQYSVIGGGQRNTASGPDAVVSGGYGNSVVGNDSFIGSGYGNTVTINGYRAVVPGGENNTAAGQYSFAAGKKSSSTANGTFTWSDSGNINNDVVTENNVADRTWFKNRGGFLVTGSTQPISDGGLFVSGAGNVGIGTTNPSEKLEIVGSDLISNSANINIGRYNNLGTGSPELILGNNIRNLSDGAVVHETQASYGYRAISLGNNISSAGIVFYAKVGSVTAGDVLANERMRITNAGNVGIGTTDPKGVLDVTSTTGAFIVPRMTTAQRDALTPVNGMIIYNTTINKFNFYENGAWVTKEYIAG